MPSPGNPKMVSTPHSISLSTSTSDAFIEITPQHTKFSTDCRKLLPRVRSPVPSAGFPALRAAWNCTRHWRKRQPTDVGSPSHRQGLMWLYPPTGSGKLMLWTIFVILLILWLVGWIGFHVVAWYIHLLLVAALVILLIRLITGRRAA